MEHDALKLTSDLIIILAVGLGAGVICKRFSVSLLVGYMLGGALLGGGGLGVIGEQSGGLEQVASAGALLLLFSIGIEFSLDELSTLGRQFVVGGLTQMVLSAVPVTLIAAWFGMSWQGAVLVGAAASLSSTVLVFKGIAELGELEAPAGRRGIAILLFQDIALAPLVLLAPMLSGRGEAPSAAAFALLAMKAVLFFGALLVLRRIVGPAIVRLLVELRSTELVCLFAIVLLGGACLGSTLLGLPAALGALAAGVVLSGSRLSAAVDAIILPFRETFAAVFFVTLGALLRPQVFFDAPLLMTAGLVGMILVKGAAGAIALRLTGLAWPSALGMGMGLAQLGEFAFLLLLEGRTGGVLSQQDYERTLLIALGTLLATPLLLRQGAKWIRRDEDEGKSGVSTAEPPEGDSRRVLVVGAGPIGRDVAAYLETSGWRVSMTDLSPVNLYRFAQQGFRVQVGDARDADVLQRAGIAKAQLAIVCVPHDETATQVAAAIAKLNPRCQVIVRCRYVGSIAAAKKAGAAEVVSEEVEAARAILDSVRRLGE